MKYKIANQWIHITMNQEIPLRLFLEMYYIGKNQARALLVSQHLLVNQKATNLDEILRIHDVVSIFLSEHELTYHVCDESEVLYEDEFTLVVNKPRGVIIHSDIPQQITLNTCVENYFLMSGQSCSVRPLHRLDQDTTGCVMYSKISFFQPYLDEMMRQKKIKREYTAICEGIVQKRTQIIDLAIGKDRHHNQKRRVSDTGQRAITKVSVECINNQKNYTVLKCILETGRTHQIRVHMQAIGHPLLSDELYGKPSHYIKRLALHARKISWNHPLSKKMIEVKAPYALDMKMMLDQEENDE